MVTKSEGNVGREKGSERTRDGRLAKEEKGNKRGWKV